MAKVEIIKLNYFGNDATGTQDFNSKCLYKIGPKTFIAHLDVDFWAKRIYVSKEQPKECKIYAAFRKALPAYEKQYFNL